MNNSVCEAQPARAVCVIQRTDIGAVGSKETAKCFTDEHYVYCDGDFSRWLRPVQPRADACTVTALTSAQDADFVEWARMILASPIPDHSLEAQIKRSGYAIASLPQIEEIVAVTERGIDTGVRTDGWGNFFFLENEEGGISVGQIRCLACGWEPTIFRFRRRGRWYGHFLVRNYK